MSDSHDLRSFFRAVGHFSGQRALTSTPVDRGEPELPAELLDEASSAVASPPLKVAAFVDGIQASVCVTHRSHRPVYLSYTAAGALGPNAQCIGLKEDLQVVCSGMDKEWVEGLGTTIPVSALGLTTPPDIEREATLRLSTSRAELERSLVEELSAEGAGVLALDGSLTSRPHDPSLVGIVKSTHRKYLADESCLFGLPRGWRSPRFVIPAGTAGYAPERYSTYLRLFDASQHAWNFGLIRLETFDPDLLDPLAALCLQERQSPGARDARWDRHLASVRACEEFLRARRPQVFAMG